MAKYVRGYWVLVLALGCLGVRAGFAQPARFPEEFRRIDGRGNNLNHPQWGSADVALTRLTRPDYSDGLRAPAGVRRLSARAVSNLCAAQTESMPSSHGVSSFFWQWGQFLDHDLILTAAADPVEPMNIAVPRGDPFFDPEGVGGKTIHFDRSEHVDIAGRREQMNSLTAFIDASQVYGSDVDRARALRVLDGTGRLAMSDGDLLPFNDEGLDNAPSSSDPMFFVAGDIRSNEQVALTAMHVLFVREHNFWADSIREDNPGLDDEDVYQHARAMVAAEMQAITYREFLPVLLGPNALPPYEGYDPDVDPGISNEFATAAFRLGHSMLPAELLRLDREGNVIAAGNLSLAEAFFAPQHVTETGIDALLRGLWAQPAQEVDPHVVDAIRNFLFGPPGAGGFDLASLNVQRGRDHGLGSYNQTRRELGLPPVLTFAQINPDPVVQENLALAFSNVEDIDLWVGGLAEPHLPGALVGETFAAILIDQFQRSRDGDRFWYEVYLPPELVAMVEQQTLSRIIQRNTDIGPEAPDDVFRTSQR